MYLLDTTHCIEYFQANSIIRQRLSRLERASIGSWVIIRAELLYMALRSNQVEQNIALVDRFLSETAIYPVDDPTADAFARIKIAIFNRFGPKEKSRQRRFTLSTLGLTDNDLWIAAIALRHNLIVVTSDGDFARIAEVTDVRHESWLVADE
ncbi:MAG: type II toxin-antitoxin system VapC family toxin [Thermomicrobiales bacterium]